AIMTALGGSLNPFTPPPSYSMNAPSARVPPRGAIDAAGPADETPTSNGTRQRPSNNENFDRLLRIQEAATPPPSSASPISPSSYMMSPTNPSNPSLSHLEAGPADIGDVQEFDREGPRYQQGSMVVRPPNATNYISLVRMSTTNRRIFSFFGNSTSIKDTFCVDPHLSIPGSVLAAVTGETGEAARRADRRRKNVKLEIENGTMDVVLHLVADNDSISSYRRRTASAANLLARTPREKSKRQTKLDIKVTTRKSTRFKAYPLKARLYAPNPRPHFHLTCTTDSPGDPGISSSASPVTLFLPRNFRGPLRLRITAGNIDRHLYLSPSVLSASVPLDEDAINRGYFIGPLHQDGELEEDDNELLAGNLNDWKGDRVEVNVEDGNVRILYEDEELGWFENMKSNGWMWPREWS
ncbi:hypothetical protein K443DRAFT_96345, partial [Laccaria amethystina LaAM-08-1]